MTINSRYIKEKKLYSIVMGQDFNYSDYRDFKGAYEKIPVDAEALELNLKNTMHIDSSALGMMLLMNEHVHKQVSHIDVTNSNPNVLKIFEISHFKKIFNITSH
ncbi:MAG: STAS domain-containing protein [Chromatiales bacterium]|nr:STAS domain-containing protein [Chromatiales bacterium]